MAAAGGRGALAGRVPDREVAPAMPVPSGLRVRASFHSVLVQIRPRSVSLSERHRRSDAPPTWVRRSW